MTIAAPCWSLRITAFIVATCEASRSIGTASSAEITAANGRQRKSELRARLASRRGLTSPRMSGSRRLWWEDRTSSPPEAGSGSANRNRIPSNATPRVRQSTQSVS